MLIITIRTDRPEAELELYEDSKLITSLSWQAHRELAETIHKKIAELLKKAGKDWSDLQGVACFKGPGSFTGLRIGLTVGNTLAYSYDIPVVATEGDGWQAEAIKLLLKGENHKVAMPEYGAAAHITLPRK